MEIKSSLERIIDTSKFRCADADGGDLKLTEKQGREVIMEVELVDFPNNAVSVKLPQNQEGFLNKEEGLTRICDYLRKL